MSGQRSSFRKFVHVLVSLTLISNSFFLALQFPLFAPSQTVYAQPGVATVTVQPQSGTIQVSDTFTVTVSIANPTTPLTAFQFDLTYDQNLLGLVDLLPGAFLSSTGRGVTCPQQAYPTWGVIRFACASSGLENAPVGTGLLAEFTFVALYPGTSPLIVSAINLAGPNVPPTPIPATPQSHTVTVTPTPGVVFGNNQTMISSPGMQVTHVFTLTNLGNYTDTFTLGVAGYTWSTTLPATTIGPLSIGETAPVEVQVDIPNSFGGTIIATDSFTITATSSHDPNISAVAQGTTLAEVNPGVTLGEDQAGSGVIQTNIHYALSVTNTGDYTDTFHLTVTSDWPTTLTHQETQPLSAGESFPYTLTVTIPQVAIGSQDTATITAISGWNTAIEDELGVTTTAIESERNTYLPIMVRSGGTTAMPATTPDSAPGLLPTGIELPRGVAYGIPQTPSQTTLLPNCYSADLDCDLDVDEADLALEAQHWNCSVADPCYSPVYDLDGNNVIDVFDLAWVGNDYDTTSPIITISTPEIGAIVGGTQVNVTGVVSDVHDIMTVTVNGMHATLVGTDYSITIPIVSGNHVLNVIATDVVGQVAAISQIIGVDADGPMINVHKPKNRQSVYSLTPTVAISYTDFYTSVNVTTFGAWLVNDAGIQTDITNDLTVTPNSAHGFISTPLIENMAYTLTISLADTLGNITQK